MSFLSLRSSFSLLHIAPLAFGVIALPGCGDGGSGASSGGQDDCASYIVEPTRDPVKVTIHNTSKSNLYLGDPTPSGCANEPEFSLKSSDGSELTWALPACALTCAQAQQGSCACAADCAAPFVRLLAPGASYEITWAGTVFTSKQMPTACYKEASCAQSGGCLEEEEPPSGTLTFAVSAWTEVMCNSGATCACTPDATGTCIIDGGGQAAVAGMELKGSTDVTMPGAAVEIDVP